MKKREFDFLAIKSKNRDFLVVLNDQLPIIVGINEFDTIGVLNWNFHDTIIFFS